MLLCQDIYPCRALEEEVEEKLEGLSSRIWDLVKSLPDTVELEPEIQWWIEAELMELRADIEHLIEKVRNKEYRILLLVREKNRG